MDNDGARAFFSEFPDRPEGADEVQAAGKYLKAVGVVASLADLETEYQDANGPGVRPPLVWFSARLPQLPVWLGHRVVPWQRDALGDVLARFTKSGVFTAWTEVSEAKPEFDARPVGVVFPWPKVALCVLHDARSADVTARPGFYLVRRLPSQPRPFVIEPYAQFLETLAQERGVR